MRSPRKGSFPFLSFFFCNTFPSWPYTPSSSLSSPSRPIKYRVFFILGEIRVRFLLVYLWLSFVLLIAISSLCRRFWKGTLGVPAKGVTSSRFFCLLQGRSSPRIRAFVEEGFTPSPLLLQICGLAFSFPPSPRCLMKQRL